jgi:DNA-directed RNA polymerase subunit E'
MYQIVTLEDSIAVPPTKFNLDVDQSVKESLEEKFEGKIDIEVGVILAVIEVNDVGEGKIFPGDPAVYYTVEFSVLSWMPKEHEIVEGEVVDITEFGAFIRAGALDGLVHVSQIMDDYVSYDEKNAQLVGKQTRKVLKVGDSVRARIISISFKEQSKVGLTMRQPFLGSFKWLEAPHEEKKPKEERDKRKHKKRTRNDRKSL